MSSRVIPAARPCALRLLAALALNLGAQPLGGCGCEPAIEEDAGPTQDARAADRLARDSAVVDTASADVVDAAIALDVSLADLVARDLVDAGGVVDATASEDAAAPCADLDGDGHRDARCGGDDCDDTIATGATCVDTCAVYFPDVDGDGHGDGLRPASRCVPPAGYVVVSDDCDDAKPACALDCTDLDGDGVCLPDDCDDSVATGGGCTSGCLTSYADLDGDGYGDLAAPIVACALPAAAAANADDCDPVNPACGLTCLDADGDGACVDHDCDDRAPTGVSCATGCATYHRDADGDGLGDPGRTTAGCLAPDGFVDDASDCDDTISLCTTDCADGNGDGAPDCAEGCADGDADGYRDQACGGIDCDDGAPAVNPGVVERCDNGVDDDCDVATADLADADGDGVRCDLDCDDAAPRCAATCVDADADGWCVDQDCDDSAATGGGCHNTCASFYPDQDGDGLGAVVSSVTACVAPAGHTARTGDCDDSNPACGATCVDLDGDGACADHDCDDSAATGASCSAGCGVYYPDADGDGYGDAATPVSACAQPVGYVARGGDCDDADPRCDTTCTDGDGDGYCLNHDCDDSAATGASCHGLCGAFYADTDGDGAGDPATAVTACAAPAGHVSAAGDCDDSNGACVLDCTDADGDGACADHDCDDAPATGAACQDGCGLYYADADADGAGDPGSPTVACAPPAGHVAVAGDCDDGNDACLADCTDADGDGACVDHDCDDAADTGAACQSGCAAYHPDVDDDGFGDRAVERQACAAPAGHVVDGGDCDDAAAAINPGASELCAGGVDEDCDDAIDAADPDCVTSGELCDNHQDDDGDGDADCADPDCVGVATCRGDTCADPLLMTGSGSFAIDTLRMSDQHAGSCQPASGRDVVFLLSLTETSDLHLDTEGSSYDTVLSVRAAGCAAGAELACSDDVNAQQAWSRVELSGLSAGDYFVWVDAALPDPGGDLTLNAVVSPTRSPSTLSVHDDPLVRMPGTQPGQGVTVEAPNRCLNCHADYGDPVAEPAHGWKGSMMAQAARDFIFWAAYTVAMQDSIWALGRPNAGDLCERCHFPQGWLEGRSEPANAAAMTGPDYDGVHCDICHQKFDPFFEDTYAGAREGDDWSGYWDEAGTVETPSGLAAATTYDADRLLAPGILLFNGDPFFGAGLRPHDPGYIENGSGQYFVSDIAAKRAPFADASARHSALYSRYHKSRYFCSSCHDVSNPVLHNLAHNGATPGPGAPVLPSEADPAHSYFHVERTFSEFMLSDFAQGGGAAGRGAFAPGSFDTSRPGDLIATCQDCHLRDVVGVGCDKNGVLVRPTESLEHPKSGMPQHDMTGGNIFVTWVLASAAPGADNFDAYNASLLDQGPAALTMDLSQGEPLDPAALLDGADRALQNLRDAAVITDLGYDSGDGALSFRVQNNTGHKLISGFPEGRRMWVNVRAYDGGGALVWEVNPYDDVAMTLRGLPHDQAPDSPPLGPAEEHVDALVYEMKPSSSLTGEAKTLHFVLADGRYKDNRIPPAGFRISEAAARLIQPVWHGLDAPDLFSAAEYAGGYDQVDLQLPAGAARVEVKLFYQTTSREYVTFLRDQINGDGSSLPSPTLAGAANAYVIPYDPYFDGLRAWGDTLWELWLYNKNVPGAAPIQMTEAELP